MAHSAKSVQRQNDCEYFILAEYIATNNAC